ncbi:MAG: diguanylate cyclase [Oscillospiraceae bacterium]|nr:diguanylate cyclase [Oscillospiraceae bacterium]
MKDKKPENGDKSGEKIKINDFLKRRQFRYLIGTIVVLASLLVLCFGFAYWMYRVTENSCYEDLKIETEDAVSALETHLRSDRTMLRLIAGQIRNEEDLESIEANGYLSNYDVNSQVTQCYMLLPDNDLISAKGHRANTDGRLDFKKEYELKDHICSEISDDFSSYGPKIRNFVQIREGGYCIGLLFSEGYASGMAQAWLPDIYEKKGYLYVVDRKTGEVIINTSPSDSITDINDLAFRQVDKFYSKSETIDKIMSGKSGYSMFSEKAAGENLYMCYLPIDIEEWEMVVVVPESAAFSAVSPVRSRLFLMVAVVAMILLIYMFWLLNEFRESIADAEEKANTDVLTGLQNRNRFEAFIGKTDALKEKLACIYIDANGLHDLNNSKGHSAGDQMLRFIADTLKVEFGGDNIYRIGGDEFVLFKPDKTEKDLEEGLAGFKEALSRNNYHAAVGICTYESGLDMDKLIKSAESKMYEAKRRYYKDTGKDMRV